MLLSAFGKESFIVALIMFGPMVVTPVWNIRIILARRRDPETKIKWRKLLIVCNLYIALWGILLLVSRPGHWAGLSGTMAVASLEGLRQARHTSKKTPKGESKGLLGKFRIRYMFDFFKKKTKTPTDLEILEEMLPVQERRVLVGLIWSLKPSDQSILHVFFKAPASDAKVGSTHTAVSGIFWQRLVKLGLATQQSIELPDPELNKHLKNTTSYSLTANGREWIRALMKPALEGGRPPKEAVILPDTIKMLERYIEEGDPSSFSKLASLYSTGSGVEKNLNTAIRLYHAGAEKHDLVSLNDLGVLYLEGNDVPKDASRGVSYLEAAAEKGAVGAMGNLGEIYLKGIGIPAEHEKAFRWTKASAERGHPLSMCRMADFYTRGFMVPQDTYQAYIWYRLGLAHGRDTRDNLEQAAKLLTPIQLEQADNFVKEWKPISP